MKRRNFIAASALPLFGCERGEPSGSTLPGGFTGIAHTRGHRLRDPQTQPPGSTHRTRVLVLGGGVAGLAAARALRQQGVDDLALLELEDEAGGNSRGGQVGGIACPLGAHYLPVPGDNAREVQDLLEELGLRQRVAGRWAYDERTLCHSPQERLFFHGEWQEGLLPLQGVGEATLAQYRRFAETVQQASTAAKYTIPISKVPQALVQSSLDAMTFEAWLDQHDLTDTHLRWYLGYCCRDDYGAGIARVSAWAGLHYFASRHGFHAPGTEPHTDPVAHGGGVLTWPEGNGWLTRRLATPLGDRLRTGRTVTRIASHRHGVEVDAVVEATGQTERWRAERAIVALPLFVAARVLAEPSDAVRRAAAQAQYAPWLVANIHLRAPLHDRPGAPPSWDNVLYGSQGLGYVDAMHQSLRPVPGATVLTWYRALGDMPDGRRALLEQPWTHWRDEALRELRTAHPDLGAKASRMDITRYGHAMAIPVPGTRTSAALQALRDRPADAWQRLWLAHSDLAGYSVFEEAFTLGHRAGLATARAGL